MLKTGYKPNFRYKDKIKGQKVRSEYLGELSMPFVLASRYIKEKEIELCSKKFREITERQIL
jgi:hypothetical protein